MTLRHDTPHTTANGAWLGAIEDAIGEFTPTSPELLARRRLLRRVDTKYVMPVSLVAPFLEALDDSYTALSSGEQLIADYGTRYFDTPSLDMFHAHRRGVRPRHKIRIRHHVARAMSFIEHKRKGPDDQTVKRRQECAFGDGDIRDADTMIRDAVGLPADALVPIVDTNFRRITLVGATHEERVTIDFDLEMRMRERSCSLGRVAIVELKQPRLKHTSASVRALRALGRRPYSMSKYCIGVCLLRPLVRRTAFAEQLRELRRIA